MTNFYEDDFNVPNLFDSSSDNEEEFDKKFQKTKTAKPTKTAGTGLLRHFLVIDLSDRF